jgi:hypothetical protein
MVVGDKRALFLFWGNFETGQMVTGKGKGKAGTHLPLR